MIKSYPMAVYLRMLARLALGGFFVASAGFKLVSPALFVEQIAAFGLISAAADPVHRLGADRP